MKTATTITSSSVSVACPTALVIRGLLPLQSRPLPQLPALLYGHTDGECGIQHLSYKNTNSNHNVSRRYYGNRRLGLVDEVRVELENMIGHYHVSDVWPHIADGSTV